eukprot:4002277-Pyramimonas_sp.AAC.1
MDTSRIQIFAGEFESERSEIIRWSDFERSLGLLGCLMARLGPQADSKGLRNPAPRREVELETLTNRSSGHLVVISCRSWG